MVELTKRPLIPFCVNYRGKDFDCLFYKKELYICTANLERELGKTFPSEPFFVLGMNKNIVEFTAISKLDKKGASEMLFQYLSSIRPEEWRSALGRAFFG